MVEVVQQPWLDRVGGVGGECSTAVTGASPTLRLFETDSDVAGDMAGGDGPGPGVDGGRPETPDVLRRHLPQQLLEGGDHVLPIR